MLALNTVYNMDCVEGLANLDDGSINSCVTIIGRGGPRL